MLNVVLVEPEIPANTGNIGRTCVVSGTHLHLVGPLGFSLDDKSLKRAGMAYWQSLNVSVYDNWDQFLEKNGLAQASGAPAADAAHDAVAAAASSSNCNFTVGRSPLHFLLPRRPRKPTRRQRIAMAITLSLAKKAWDCPRNSWHSMLTSVRESQCCKILSAWSTARTGARSTTRLMATTSTLIQRFCSRIFAETLLILTSSRSAHLTFQMRLPLCCTRR